MRGFLLFFLSVGIASAQLSVQIRASKDMYLVYEGIPVTVSIRNYSGRTIQLENTGETSWLKFVITDESNNAVPATAEFVAGEAVLIPAGQTISRVIDLLPFYQLRSRGTYRVQAAVTGGGMVASSPQLNLILINGREVWTQTIGLPMVDSTQEEYRVYSLLARREGTKEQLYVGLRGEPSGTVFSLVPLGPCLSTSDIQARLDKEANLHVIFQNGPRSYGYVQINTGAKVVTRAAYSDYLSTPGFQETNNLLVVVGGEQTYPRPERILSDDEVNPPPPPPKPKPKKKWYWPFAPKHEPGTDQ
ncbi:MAG: hypothetical protein WCS70_13335 [Verrucomicrobiota bacterium]